jgi:hypothetical protein
VAQRSSAAINPLFLARALPIAEKLGSYQGIALAMP